MAYQKGEGKSVVIALGGNALGDTPQEQLELVKNTAEHIVDMVAEGINVVVSHGNGPQVGMINNAFDYASTHDGKTPAMPFPECGAMSQGYIGYQLSQAILNEMKRRGIMRSTACVITQTVVYPEDPAFQNPTKPVGAFLTEEEAMKRAEETGYTYKEDAGRGWRHGGGLPRSRSASWRFDAIKDLMDDGYIVISTGGGGVPVDREGRLLPRCAGGYRQGPLERQACSRLPCRHAGYPHGGGEGVHQLQHAGAAGAERYDGGRGPRSTSTRASSLPARCCPKVEACIEFVRAAYPEGTALITCSGDVLPTA